MANAKHLLRIPAVGGPRSGQCFCVPELPPIGSFFRIAICDPLLPLRGMYWYELELRGGQPVYRFVGRKLPAHVAYVGRN